MTKREFAEQVAEIIGGEVVEVEKANGIVKIGVTIRTNNISPNVYIDDMYSRGDTVGEVAEIVKNMLEDYKVDNFDASVITDFEKVKPLLRVRLYNNTTTAEVKRDAEQYGFEGLIIVPAIEFTNQQFGIGLVKVTTKMLDGWGKTPKEIIDIAIENTKGKYVIKGMTEIIMEMQGIPEEERETFRNMIGNEETMYVISNDTRCYGAIGAIFAREELERRFPNGYVILPSSVHEVICVPITGDINENELTQMVQEVNATQVSPEERLADRAFYFAA